jgi:hypothetical protein
VSCPQVREDRRFSLSLTPQFFPSLWVMVTPQEKVSDMPASVMISKCFFLLLGAEPCTETEEPCSVRQCWAAVLGVEAMADG